VTSRSNLSWGALGPLLFIAVFLVDGATRAGYEPMRHQVSYLSLGDRGWIQVASFLVTGALLIAFAFALHRALRSGIASVGGPVAVGLTGAGLVVAGIFPTVPAFGYPPGTPDGFPTEVPATAYLHVLGAFCFFGGMIAACLIMARRFRRQPEDAWAAYSIATAVLVVVFFGASSADASGNPFFPAFAGLLQRVSIIAGLTWIAALAERFYRRAVVASGSG
jgi:hypothetical membrane protein